MLLVEMRCSGCDSFVPDSQPTIPGEGSCSDENTGVKKTLAHWTPVDAAVNNGVFAGKVVPITELLRRVWCFKNSQPGTKVPARSRALRFLAEITSS